MRVAPGSSEPTVGTSRCATVAWNYSMFDWSEVLAGNIITPARAGRPYRYQPPRPACESRSGALELP